MSGLLIPGLRNPLTFGLGGRSRLHPVAAAPEPSDRYILGLIADLIRDTGEFDFDEVVTTGTPESFGRGVSARLACLELLGWSEDDEFDDADATPQEHTATFRLTILYRDSDADARDDEVDRLYRVLANVINGQSLGGFTYPEWTRLTSGTYLAASAPERRMQAEGTFRYTLTNFDNH